MPMDDSHIMDGWRPRRTMMMRTLGSAVLLLSLTLPAQAQAVIIVDAAGGGDFTEIQPAVDAAPVGSLIRIRHGAYQGVTIRKGLRLIGDKPDLVNGTGVLIEGSTRVLDLPARQSFVGTDLFLLLSCAEPRSCNFENCRGNIHLADSFGRLQVRQCNYVTTDLVGGEASSVEPGARRGQLSYCTNRRWHSPWGLPVLVESIRSKGILIECTWIDP